MRKMIVLCWLWMWYIYTNICIQEYVSKPRNDHHYLMTKVAKALNILSNSDDRSWTTLRLITKICLMIMVTEIFYRTMSIITKISPLSCKSFWSSALGQIDHRQVGVLKIMMIIKYNDNDYNSWLWWWGIWMFHISYLKPIKKRSKMTIACPGIAM